MGERAFQLTATDDDLDRMSDHLRQALEAGAIGLSTSRSPNHQTSDERPVASRLASWDEVRRLVSTMGDLGAGFFEIANEDLARSSDPDERAGYLNKLRALSAETGIPVTFGVQAIYDPEEWRAQLAALGPTDGGGRLFGQCNSRPTNTLRSFRTMLPFDHMPEWHAVRQLPLEAQKPLLRDPNVRKQLVHAAHHGEYQRFVGPTVRKPDWDTVLVYARPLPPYQTVSEAAAERNVDPVEAVIDLALESDFDTLFMQCSKGWYPEGAVEVMRHPFTVMTFSDSGAHVSQICDSSIHTSFLGYWVRQQGTFGLEQAVEMITSVPAREWGFSDRGLLRPGLAADINIFDPDRIGPEMPRVVDDLPAGARRLVLGATGIKATVVNGRTTIRDGNPTGELAGQLLRGPLAAGTSQNRSF
jgi:N-acyl-D-aspartate/D-glutamate deacylase